MKSSDKLAIHELLSRAAYCFDERKLDVLKHCFTVDASMLVNITGSGEVGPFKGREAIIKLMSDTLASQTDVRRHVISNFFFEAEGNRAATVFSSLVVTSVENGEINVIISGIYRDEVVKEDGDWRISHRHLNLDIPF
ncbi:MAG: nuclear transport factor 2 family protein [Proteobacteria bacterium]|nr:nuclear transport factor 2 family protein [Pseudomonadota bacterium]MCH8257995.1 nuclear transport factor 2 family protein [Pseudomonadota bacterium]